MKRTRFLTMVATLIFPAISWAQHNINDGQWKITFNEQAKTLTYSQNGKEVVKGAYIEIHKAKTIHDNKAETLLSTSYPTVSLSNTAVADAFGNGTKYTYTYSGLEGKDNIEQSIYIYPGKNYLLVEAALVAKAGETKANYIAPVVSKTATAFLPTDGKNYVYDMPHDNDNWVGYSAIPFAKVSSTNQTSCEVSGAYDAMSRMGLVVGSIEHDTWKSGITIKSDGKNAISELTVAAGVVNARTNDVQFKNDYVVMNSHGAVAGNKVRSPRFFLGLYNDWRNGFEDLGEATATLCPKLEWNGGTIFAWQSWGGMADKVNYAGAVDVADFFKEQMMPKGFVNENGVCHIVLDSFWDNLSDFQLRLFAQHCKANGQKPGIYHTPFSCWLGSENDLKANSPYNGSKYKWYDLVLTGNGKKRKIASYALDPTHPGTKEYNRQRFAKFKDLGFEYIKLDFINNGTLEADSYYDPKITTGMQAYTYGMNYILEFAKDAGMFVDLSIAPIFPAKGHARRISCDCWGELDNSMYGLNSLDLGWWLDRVYCYNDPDHLVLSRAENDGQARIRYTMGAMTGTVLLGDNYSLKGTCLGNQKERDLALSIATNKAINDVARIGRSFRPVEGMLDVSFNRYQYSYGVDREFTLDTDDALYYVVFNYDKSKSYTKAANFERLGIDASNVKSIKELWSGKDVTFSGNSFNVSVAKTDVCLYRIEKKTPTAIAAVEKDKSNELCISYSPGSLYVKASEAVASLSLFNMQGNLLYQKDYSSDISSMSLPISSNAGVYLVKVTTKSGDTLTKKIMIN